MTTMAQPNPKVLPENAETAQLRAEIQRMADMVSGVVRQTGIDGINAAMAIAATDADSAARDATKVAQQILERASVMQNEIDRFLAIANGRHAA
jgi:cell division septum initiation protein DivIVA